jgi:hypothetical protein
MPPSEAPRKTPYTLLIVSWLVVLIPATWGVTQTVKNSLKLFTAPPPASQPH